LKSLWKPKAASYYFRSPATPVFEVYADRITITSSGELADGMSKEEFFAGYSMPRNRELMRIFKDVRLVEQLGSGIQRILNAYKKSVFTFTATYIKVTFPYLQHIEDTVINASVTAKTEVIEVNDAIVQLIYKNNRIEVEEIAKNIGLNSRSILRRLQKLQEDGIIRRVGSSRGGHWEITG
jgi:ATP-dependent DNA helicase RecG